MSKKKILGGGGDHFWDRRLKNIVGWQVEEMKM